MQVSIPVAAPEVKASSSMRLRSLDTLRGLASALVVFLHAGIPYMTNPIPYLVWPARDRLPSNVIDVSTWCLECFLMPLFFVLGGFFSQGLLQSRGEREFLISRTRRLWLTQLTASLVILPICLAVWTLGWVADGIYIPRNFMNLGIPRELEAELYGVSHIWFLQNLYIYCLIQCAASWLIKRYRKQSIVTIDHKQSWCLDNAMLCVWKPLIPAIPCALVLYWDPRIVVGFYQTFFPVFSKLVYYSIYFFFGAALNRHRAALPVVARFGIRYLIIAGILFAFALPLIQEHVTTNLVGERRFQMASLLSLFAWFATFGLIAVFLRMPSFDNVVTRYLSEASFWIYLIHLPIVVLAQIAVARAPIPTLGKFLVAGVTALALGLLTYHAGVRRTWLGRFLNGQDIWRKTVADSPSSVVSPLPAAAVLSQEQPDHSSTLQRQSSS